ncbi:MAG: aminotransferase class V-fold PLP-dependent enzyme [Gemmatimonadota bacterium]
MLYFDHAATSASRPSQVVQAVADFLSLNGASPGRGGYSRSVDSGRICFRCRRKLAGLMGLRGSPGRLAFMMNATHALNTALFGLLQEDDVVVVSPFDHNAVLRPVHYLSRARGVQIRVMEGDAQGAVDLQGARGLMDGARVVVVNAVSNVLGTRLPLEELAGMAHEAGALVLVDAAQSAGHLTDRPGELGADLVAMTGHKGLLGPQGTGALWLREGVEIPPLLSGGTGGDSALREMPHTMPDHLEAGTPNAPGIAGLLAGLEFLEETGVERLHTRISELKLRLHGGLSAIAGVTVLSPPDPAGVGVVTMVSDRTAPSALAAKLDREFGIMTRAGLHCAPEAHRLLGTSETGALRFSLGWDTTAEGVDTVVDAVEQLVSRDAASTSGVSHTKSEVGRAS